MAGQSRGAVRIALRIFSKEALKVYSLGISLLGLLRVLSGQLYLETSLEDSLQEFP